MNNLCHIIDDFNEDLLKIKLKKLDNKYRIRKENERIFRAQNETYNYYRNKLEVVIENL